MKSLDLDEARVCLSSGDRARVLLNGIEMDAFISGALEYAAESAADLPATGDYVLVRRVDTTTVLIEQVLPRRTKISRRAAGTRHDEQMLAANVDLAMIVCGLDGDFNPRRLERYLALAQEGGVEPVIVLNKADACAGHEERVAETRQASGGAAVLVASALTGDGCAAVCALLAPGITAVLLGSSGAGKSTLLNRIVGSEIHSTGDVRADDSRGRHTTTHRELIPLPGGAALIDSPGLREVQLWATAESVSVVFDDIAALSSQCRFADCGHRNEPGCAVRGNVAPDRLDSFHKLMREAARLADTRSEKVRWRAMHKAARQFYKLRGRK
ncbi:MAG: ribosome small subunit-dependent GTPase A [Acidobacteriota bacterium]